MALQRYSLPKVWVLAKDPVPRVKYPLSGALIASEQARRERELAVLVARRG